jgi:hypothetical protein
MFQPQPTPYSPFSSYGINLSPPLAAPPLQSSLPLDFNNYNSVPLPLQQQQQQAAAPPPPQQLQQQPLPHSHPHSRPHSHPHLHANSISISPQSSSASSHSPPATIVDNNPSSPIAVGAQSGHSATAGRRLGSTLHQFQERHPHPHQQPIFSPVNHNHNHTLTHNHPHPHAHNHNPAASANPNPNVTLPSNLPHNANANSLPALPPFAQHPQQQYKMAGNEVSDMEAQEALAREFQPNLEVCRLF